jgi:hypothetical protein
MPDSPEVKVRLTAEDQGVAAAIKELGAQLTNLKSRQDETATSGLNLSKAFQGIAAAAATIRLASFAKEAFDSAVNIGKMADKTGLTTQTLSVFHKVAEDVGVSTEAVDKGLVRAAKSITQFEQGSKTATLAFASLGITTKSFAGLNADQKIILLATALGKHAASLSKANAAQLIFNRGGAEMILVANALAAQGMDKATAATSRLGLLLDQKTTDSFRTAKGAMQELQDAGKGVATQFESGLLPAVIDVSNAVLESVNIGGKGGDGFREMGKVAGTVVRDIAAGFISMGVIISAEIAGVGSDVSSSWTQMKIGATSSFEAIGLAAKGHFAEAKAAFDAGTRDMQREAADNAARQKAIWDDAAVHIRTSMENLFPSDAEEARRMKEGADRLRPENQEKQGPTLVTPELANAAGKAQLALALKQMQDELEIKKSMASEQAQVDKHAYDEGLLSMKDYFDRRRAEVIAENEAEKQLLLKESVDVQNELAQTVARQARLAANPARTPQQTDTLEAQRLGLLQKIDELNTQIQLKDIAAGTEIGAIDREQQKAQEESAKKLLVMKKEIADLQGDKPGAAQVEIKAQAVEQTRQAQQAGGPNLAANLAEIETWKQLKLAVADYDMARQKTEEDIKAFEIQKKAIQLKAKAGGMTPLEEEQKINQLIKERLPLLQADAAAELAAAQKTGGPGGNQADVAAAQNSVAQVQNLTVASNRLGLQISQSLTQDFQSFFDTVGRGTKTLSQQFEGLAASVVSSIEKIIEKELMLKLLGSAADASGAGGTGFMGWLSNLGSGHAEGGLIKGPGGPKSDSIPARLSAGEFVVKADAVQRLGVHSLDAMNRGLQIPSIAQLSLPKFAEGGPVGLVGAPGASGMVNIGLGLDKGLILQHLSSKDAGRIILNHLTNNPKAAGKALSRSQ